MAATRFTALVAGVMSAGFGSSTPSAAPEPSAAATVLARASGRAVGRARSVDLEHEAGRCGQDAADTARPRPPRPRKLGARVPPRRGRGPFHVGSGGVVVGEASRADRRSLALCVTSDKTCSQRRR